MATKIPDHLKVPKPSKISPDQWTQVQEWVRADISPTSREVAARILREFGITYSHQGLSQHRLYRAAKEDRKISNAEEVREELEANVKIVAAAVMKTIKLRSKERDRLESVLGKMSGGDPLRRQREARLKDCEVELRQSTTQFNDLHKSANAAGYAAARIEDRDSQECQDAINELLGKLEFSVGGTSRADEILAERAKAKSQAVES